ncbi:RSD-2 domain-containing protein [Caenorhabditis elegans]|nr:RSD-2 domain-containing protein [Caenorhabditis elegans]CAJ76945.1 RSD-2 domain-containing protein [Caenorhabditis elegans]|eukprot:NP_001040953.1 Uncharacterized protein CELE_F52G2.2 [Caenorhabditis elegans]
MSDSQVIAIILFDNEETNSAICYSEQLESSIKVHLPVGSPAKAGQLILFTEYNYENDTYFPDPRPDAIEYRECEMTRIENGELLISAKAACSSIETHITYPQSVAFADTFGKVNVAAESMERGVTYRVELAINIIDSEANNVPLFKISDIGEKLTGEENEAFLRKLNDFEELQGTWEDWTPEEIAVELEPVAAAEEPADPEVEEAKIEENGVNDESLTQSESDSVFLPQIESSASSEETMSESNSAENSEKPKKTFGRMPQSLSESSSSTISSSKVGVDHSVIVLNVDNDECVGFETTQLKLMTICTAGVTVPLRPYGIFQFIAAGNNYGKTSIQTQSARVSECEGAVFSSDDVPKISANVIFSSNPKHKSYNKEVGVSDRYGFVEIPRITGDFEFGTVYSTQITMVQYGDPLKACFKAVAPLKRQFIDDLDHYLQVMGKYEDNIYQLSRKNGLGAKSISRLPNEPRNGSKHGSTKRFTTPHVTGLVVDMEKRGNYFGCVWTCFGDVVFKSTPTFSQNGGYPSVGDLVNIRVEILSPGTKDQKNLGASMTEKPASLSTTVIWRNNGFIVKAYLIMKPEKLIYSEDNNRFYEHDQLGIVVADSSIYGSDNEQSKVFEFERLRNPITLGFTTNLMNKCYWAARLPMIHREPSPPEPINKYNDENVYDDFQKGGPQSVNSYRSDRQYQEKPPMQYQSYHDPADTISIHSQDNHRPMETRSNAGTSVSSVDRKEVGVVMKKVDKNTQIVYLSGQKAAAIHHWNTHSQSTIVGNSYIFMYRPIEVHKATHYAPFEITQVVEILNTENHGRVDRSEFSSLFTFDLCNVDQRYVERLAFGEALVLRSNDVGHVVMASNVKTPLNPSMTAVEVCQTYKGKRESENLVGYCRLVYGKVPREIVDGHFSDQFVSAYYFELHEILATSNAYIVRNENLDRRNLRGNTIEEVRDDISIQKRIAHMNFGQNEQQQQQSSLSSRGPTRPYSPVGSYQSSHQNFDNRSAAHNGDGRSTSQSHHSAGGSMNHQNFYQPPVYQSSSSQQSYQPRYNGAPSGPLPPPSSQSSFNGAPAPPHYSEMSNDYNRMVRKLAELTDTAAQMIINNDIRQQIKNISPDLLDDLERNIDACQREKRHYYEKYGN